MKLVWPARGGAVVAHAGHAELEVGADVHDRAAVLLHRAQVDFLRHQEGRGHVVADHRIPAVERDVLERRRELSAGIVHQPVDPSAPFDHAVDGGLHLVFLAQVGGEGEGVGIAEFLLHTIELLLRAPDQREPSAERLQLVRRAAAEARAAAGDDDRLAVEQAATITGLIVQGLNSSRCWERAIQWRIFSRV